MSLPFEQLKPTNATFAQYNYCERDGYLVQCRSVSLVDSETWRHLDQWRY